MKNKLLKVVSLIVLIFLVSIFVLIIKNSNQAGNKPLAKPDKGLVVKSLGDNENYSVSILHDVNQDLIDSEILSNIYEIRKDQNDKAKLQLLFNKRKHKLVRKKAYIAFWTGSNWQEIKTYDSGKYLIAETSYSGYFALIKYSQPAILFVHGLGANHKTWTILIDSLCTSPGYIYRGNFKLFASNVKNTVFEPVNDTVINNETTILYTLDFSDNQNLSFDEQGEEVKLVIEEILSEQSCRKIILIGHSMGGLACRAYINNYGTKNIGGYISVTSPHMGSFLALLKRNSDNLLLSTINFFYTKIDINSSAISYLEPGSTALRSLNSKDFPEYLPLGIITSIWKNRRLGRLSGLIAENLKKKYQDELSPSQIEEFSLALRNELTDGVVTYPSQCIKNAVPNGDILNPIQLNTDLFHNDSNKDTECMRTIIDSIITIYAIQPYPITAGN